MATSGRHASAGMLLAMFAGAALLLVPVSGILPAPASSVRPAVAASATVPSSRVQRARAAVAAVTHLIVPDLPLPAQATYTIAAGDTLWTIAQSTGVSVEALAAVNGLPETSVLHLGQVLTVPVTGTRAAQRTAARATPASLGLARPATHVVVSGDTLWTIAQSTGVSVEALAAANGSPEAAILRLGRVLTVPAPGTPAQRRAAAAHATPAAHPTAAPAASAAGPVGSASSVGAAGTAAPVLPRRLALRRPSGGIITSRFGWRIHPIFGTREFHTGIDIATRYGSPVVAARAGIVRFVGWEYGYGRIITVDHGAGLETYYSHLSVALVSPGQRVARGQVIGRIGCTGWCTGPHLFFEVRRNGVPLDPSRYLN